MRNEKFATTLEIYTFFILRQKSRYLLQVTALIIFLLEKPLRRVP